MDQKELTRIDLEQVSQSLILVNGFAAGWKEGHAINPDWASCIEGERLLDVLHRYKMSGYALSMITLHKWRCLKGEITRVDFLKDGVWTVKEYPFGWTARTEPLNTKIKGNDFDVEKALAWLRSKGWVVVTWQGGARAWKYRKMPVRTKEEILELRRRSDESRYQDGRRAYNLAYYF